MKSFNLATTLARAGPWTCRSCLQQAQGGIRGGRQIKSFATRAEETPKRRRGRVVVAVTAAAVGVAAIAFKDDAKHAYRGAERSGRVLGTLALCINEYGSMIDPLL